MIAKLTDYSLPSDTAADAHAAIQNACDAVAAAGGGTITGFPPFLTLKSRLDLVYNNISIKFLGDLGNVIKCSNPSDGLFYAGNLNQLIFDSLVFLGDNSGSVPDCSYVVLANYTVALTVRNCQTFRLRAGQIIFANRTRLIAEQCIFGNSHVSDCEIRCQDTWAVDINQCESKDYEVLHGTYYGDEIRFPCHIYLENIGFQAGHGGHARIVNCVGDEGADFGIHAKNVKSLEVMGYYSNLSHFEGAAGILLDNVKNAKIGGNSRFGSGNGNPMLNGEAAVRAINNSNVTLEGLVIEDGANIQKDSTSRTNKSHMSFPITNI